ncbi:MAG: aminopeptidase P family protein [Alphaproteobacteria bacterium]|nr:aminopeptidase P family protein [Alphaproteobacteria bacterium]
MADRQRLKDLRAELEKEGLGGFVVPHGDEYRSESLPESSKRLEWLSGFSGSAGTVVVLKDKAAIFVDSRYDIQAPQEVDGNEFEIINSADKTPMKWLSENLPKGEKFGFDAWLHTPDEGKKLESVCEKAGGSLVMVEKNPVDEAWKDQPEKPMGKVFTHPIEYSGCRSEYKRRQVAQDIKKQDINAVVVTNPASVAWLLNIRGNDVSHSPKPLVFAVVHDNETVDLVVDPAKLTKDVKEHLGNRVNIVSPEKFGETLDILGKENKKVQIDTGTVPLWVEKRLKDAKANIHEAKDPCELPKATKNKVEQEGAKLAHIRDGVALTKFLAWIDKEAPKGKQTEISIADKLESFRKESDLYRGASFSTISGAGSNGAIVHYSATKESNSKIEEGMLLLVDSGGQYPDGTTDVTRTVVVGKPTEEEKKRFTQVLQGHIAIDSAKFPKRTTGTHLDILARQPLWEDGQDFGHGTGHGVGSYLDVHEGPQNIGQGNSKAAPLEAGMLVSNEPGFYKEGAFGIRIENIIMVKEPKKAKEGDKEMMSFETLTLAPMDRNLINAKMLTPKETKWIDNYHTKVRETLSPLLDKQTATWLKKATEPLGNTKASLAKAKVATGR